MDHTDTLQQARTMAELLPALMRQLVAGENDSVQDLPLTQLRVCHLLYRGPQSMSALGRELAVSLSAMTQLADRMEQAGLVKRVPKWGDRRIRCLQLTDHGEKMMRRRDDARTERLLAVLKRIDPHAREEVLAALHTLIQASVAARGHDAALKEHGPHILTSKVLP